MIKRIRKPIFFRRTAHPQPASIIEMMSRTVTELSDFYADDESASRGVLIYQNLPELMSERLSKELNVETPVHKSCSRFPRNTTAPIKPTDPLYVFSKWCVTAKADGVADIANVVIDATEAVFNKKCDVTTNMSKCKIAVRTPGGLVTKIKFFELPGDRGSFMVMFRKDAGDWFAFSSFFNACTKFIDSQGISLTPI